MQLQYPIWLAPSKEPGAIRNIADRSELGTGKLGERMPPQVVNDFGSEICKCLDIVSGVSNAMGTAERCTSAVSIPARSSQPSCLIRVVRSIVVVSVTGRY